jgi:hypothetical protein
MRRLLILSIRARVALNARFHPRFASHLRRRLGQLNRTRRPLETLP